jgi:hypothetical protein
MLLLLLLLETVGLGVPAGYIMGLSLPIVCSSNNISYSVRCISASVVDCRDVDILEAKPFL